MIQWQLNKIIAQHSKSKKHGVPVIFENENSVRIFETFQEIVNVQITI